MVLGTDILHLMVGFAWYSPSCVQLPMVCSKCLCNTWKREINIYRLYLVQPIGRQIASTRSYGRVGTAPGTKRVVPYTHAPHRNYTPNFARNSIPTSSSFIAVSLTPSIRCELHCVRSKHRLTGRTIPDSHSKDDHIPYNVNLKTRVSAEIKKIIHGITSVKPCLAYSFPTRILVFKYKLMAEQSW